MNAKTVILCFEDKSIGAPRFIDVVEDPEVNVGESFYYYWGLAHEKFIVMEKKTFLMQDGICVAYICEVAALTKLDEEIIERIGR